MESVLYTEVSFHPECSLSEVPQVMHDERERYSIGSHGGVLHSTGVVMTELNGLLSLTLDLVKPIRWAIFEPMKLYTLANCMYIARVDGEQPHFLRKV